ncbi:MAG: hypothetical protein ACTS27_04485 [Phycisphaerales bacterium]
MRGNRLTRLVLSAGLCLSFTAAHAVGDDFPGFKSKLKDAKKAIEKAVEPDEKKEETPAKAPEKQAEDAKTEPADSLPERLMEPTRRIPLGPLPVDLRESPLTFSPDFEKVAYKGRTGSRRAVMVNGKAGPWADDIGAIKFTADGSKVVYSLRRGERWHVVIGDELSPPFPRISEGPIVAPVGDRVAFVAVVDTEAEKWHEVVWDSHGSPSEPTRSVRKVAFTPDGAHLLYSAYLPVPVEEGEEPDFETVYVVNGERTTLTEVWTHDRVNDVVGIEPTEDGRQRLVVNGAPTEHVFDKFGNFRAMATGMGWYCLGANKTGKGSNSWGEPKLIVNGNAGRDGEYVTNRGTYDKAPEVHASSSGEHFVIVEPFGRGQRVVDGSDVGPEYRSIHAVHVRDDGGYSYLAIHDGYAYMVRDGAESEGIRLEQEDVEVHAAPDGSEPAIIIQPVQRIDFEGRMIDARGYQVLRGEYRSPVYKDGVHGLTFSRNGQEFAFFGRGPDNTAATVQQVVGQEAVVRWTGSGIGEISLGETGVRPVFLTFSNPFKRRGLPVDDAGNPPSVRVEQKFGQYAVLPFVVADGEFLDLFGGIEIKSGNVVHSVFLTPENEHLFYWFGDGGNVRTSGRTTHLMVDGTAIWKGEAFGAKVGVTSSGSIASLERRSFGFITDDGSAFRCVVKNGDAMELLEFDLAEVRSRLQTP